MSHATQRMVDTLASLATIPLDLVLFGGGAMTLAYRLERSTEDLDILINEKDLQIYAERGFGDILDKVNRQLEPQGLYIRHLWSPSQEVLCSGWETRLVRIESWWKNPLLQLRAVAPIDLVASKLVRFDEVDQGDIRHLLRNNWVNTEELTVLPNRLVIPTAFETEANEIHRRACSLATWRKTESS